ncbi:MAG: hypothetical protein QXR42_09055 [Candidatus Bathyarchaeia archaeon]
MLIGLEKTKSQVEIYNIGSEDQVNVKTIAKIVTKKETQKHQTQVHRRGRCWKRLDGRRKNMFLDTGKLKGLG